jgi:hypothetical protein
VLQIYSKWKEIARKTSIYNCTFSRYKTITIVSWGSNIAKKHYLPFLISVKQDFPQVRRAELQIIFAELLYFTVNKNRL